MGLLDIFKVSRYKREISRLSLENAELERDLIEADNKLNNYDTNKKLGRLLEVPRRLGSKLYIIMGYDVHPELDKDIIIIHRSTEIKENNIKVIAINITHYIIQPSGIYAGFEDECSGKSYYIRTDSPNLFYTMDAAISEMYNSIDKSKYNNDPLAILKREYTLNIVN